MDHAAATTSHLPDSEPDIEPAVVPVSDPRPVPTHRLLSVAEEELSRIILDIHDGPVQYIFTALSLLTGLQNDVANAGNEPQSDVAPRLAQVAMLLESSLYEIKFFLGTFRPPEFRTRSLESIVQGLVIQHEEWTGNSIELETTPLPDDMTLPVKIALYRILQEALSNAYRHSGVEQQSVRLWASDTHICMDVNDQGRGFDPPDLDAPAGEFEDHIGLRGMRDRVEILGGRFHLASTPGAGTRISVEVPAHV